MPKVPKKVAERVAKQVGVYQRVLRDAQDRDVNEADTVTIVTDILSTVLGYDKYSEITREQAIRGGYCDLAITQKGVAKYLIEVKAIGLTLKENHLRQAVNYAAGHGVPWVALTNGVQWDVYRVTVDKSVDHERVFSFNFLELSPRRGEHQEWLYLLSKEGLSKAAIEEFHEHVQIVNRFVIGAIIRSEPCVGLIRRELKRMSPTAGVSTEEIATALTDVLKRDVIEGDAAKKATRQVQRSAAKTLRKKRPEVAAVKTRVESEDSPGL